MYRYFFMVMQTLSSVLNLLISIHKWRLKVFFFNMRNRSGRYYDVLCYSYDAHSTGRY